MSVMRVLLVALFAALAVSASLPAGWQEATRADRAALARAILAEPAMVRGMNVLEFFRTARGARLPGQSENLSMECAFCGVAVNEVEALLAENVTMSVIQAKISADVCAHLSGSLASACSLLVSELPSLVQFIDNKWSVSQACIELGMCTAPFPDLPETVPMPTFAISLDDAPSARWTGICSNATYSATWRSIVAFFTGALPDGGKRVEEFGQLLNSLVNAEYAQEIQGCAAAMDVGYGWVTVINIGYEVSDACTSVVVQNDDGTVMHARNLDFWSGYFLTDTLKSIALVAEFSQGGEWRYSTATFVGYVGALSVASPAFSATIDTRFYPNGIWQLFDEIIVAIEERNATLVAFLARDAAAEATTFAEGVTVLSTVPLIADVYYTIAGTEAGQGTVLARNRESVDNSTTLDYAAGKWYVAVTNYPWWEPQPFVDNRLTPLYDNLNGFGPSITFADLFTVISSKPTLNLQTTYTIMAIPAQQVFNAYTRNCPYPCSQ